MMKQTTEFKKGDKVIYVPTHANGNIVHPDCERGEVVGKNDYYVFVRYEGDMGAKATSTGNLVLDNP